MDTALLFMLWVAYINLCPAYGSLNMLHEPLPLCNYISVVSLTIFKPLMVTSTPLRINIFYYISISLPVTPTFKVCGQPMYLLARRAKSIAVERSVCVWGDSLIIDPGNAPGTCIHVHCKADCISFIRGREITAILVQWRLISSCLLRRHLCLH